jgi:uridine kinase
VTRWLRDQLEECQVLELDHFRLSREARRQSRRYGSHPLGNDLDRVTDALSRAGAGQPVFQPVFDRESGRAGREIELPPARVYLIDGEIAAHTYLRPHFDLFLLVTTPLVQQFLARVTRDRHDRACSLKKCLHLFWQSNVLDYPRFAARASEEAHVHLRRNSQHCFIVLNRS